MADDIFTSEPERIIAQRNHVHDLDRLAADRLEEENDPVATIARFSSANVSGGVRKNLSISDAIDILAEERMQRENLVKWQLAQASRTNPDAEARLQQQARQIGLPADVARDDPETVAKQAYRKQLDGKDFEKAPATLEVLSDPNVAKVAHDDTDNMFDLDNWHKHNPLAFALDVARSFGAGLIGGSVRGVGGMASTQVRAFPVSGVINDAEVNAQIMGYDTGNANERVAEAVKQGEELAKVSGVDEIYNTGKEWTDAIRGDVSGYGFIGKSVLSGFESMGAMIPGMALSFLTKNPLPGLTAAGMMEGSDAIMENLKAGKPFGEAILHGVINGSIEVSTEAIPVSKLINDVDIGKKLFSVLIRNWIRETPSEMVATAGQTLSDRIFAMKDGESLSGTITQWAKELPEAEAETVLATMVMSFGMGAFGKGVRQIQTRQMSEAVASLNDNAKASKVRGRAKEIYERLAQTVGKNKNIDNAYIDAERWNEYFQEIGEDPHAMAERFGVVNYEDGSVGSFLQIPFGKYQSDFSATEYAQAFVNDTKFSDTERTASEQARFIEKTKEELAGMLRTLDEESGRAQLVKDAIGRLTDKIAIQLENTYDKQTSRLQAEVLARMFSNTIINDAISNGTQATPEALADMVDALFSTEGPSIQSGTGMKKRSVDPAIDAQLEKLRRNELPKERDVYGQSLMEYIRKKGGLRPDDITRDLVKNRQLPRSILNEKGMGADELASLQDVLDFGLDTETMRGDNALLDALVAEYTTGEKRYSNTQLNSELLSEAQALNDLSRDLAAAGIDLSNTDNAAVREALSKYYEEQNGENTREEPEASETLRYEQRGFTESDTPTAEERAEADRQYDEIEKKYKGTPLWMKAPNGEPTKLTERQWVQVRTPNFKRWFGDWEKAGTRERLENQEPVLVEAKYHIENSKERKAKAVELLDEDITVQKAIGPVNISKSGIRKSFGHSTSDAKLDVIPHLREILEKAEYLDTLNDFDGKDIQNHYFAARITHDGQNKIVFLRARKMPGRGNQLYVHDVFIEDEIKQKAGSPLQIREYGEKAISRLRGSDLYKSILQDIYATDNESVSKVVDSNGEPKASDVEVFLSGQNILYQREPVVRLTGDELGVPIDAPLKEHVAAAKKYHDELKKEIENGKTLLQPQLEKPVRLSSRGWRKNVSGGANKLKWSLFPKLREIVENSVLVETREATGKYADHYTKWHWCEIFVSLNGENRTVGFALLEDADGNLFYNLNAEPLTKNPRNHQSSSHGPRVQDTASDILEQSIGQNADGVNLFILNEKKRGKVRGSYDYVNNIIRLTKAADYSTFVHESAHFMLEMVARMANQESASSYITKQYDTICEYLGAEKGERFTREQHETFARSFEAYLKEGKAPTPALRSLFRKFADWLKHIYRSISLHVTLNKDIREVFDRMIVTEAELEMAKKQKEYTELFATAEDAGLTQEEFDLYRKTGDKELGMAQEKWRARIFTRVARKKTKEYRVRKKAMEQQVAADYDAMPIIRLMDALSDRDHPELSLNKNALIDRYGKAYIGKLPRRNGRAICHADGLMDLDDVAIDAGYESGDDLLKAWQELPTKKEFVAAETEKRLAETDRQMDYDVASEALDNEGHDERLKAELAIIRRLATKWRKAQIAAIERDVRYQTEAMAFVAGDIIRDRATGDIRPEMYRRAMQKAADQAFREIRKTKPDYEKAARAKQAEMMNHFLFREAMKARGEIERGSRKAKRILNVKTETYRNRLDSLNANKAKFIAASLLGSARKEALLNAVHTEEKYEKEAAAQWLYDVGPMKTTPYRDVLVALDDMDAYYSDARRERQVIIDGRRMDAIDVAGDLAEKVLQIGQSKYVTDNVRSVKNDVINGLHFTKNILTRMEHLCYFFDGDRKGVGPWLKNVFAPTLAAGVRYRQRRDAVAKEFSEILDGFEFRKGVIHSEELDFTFGKGRRSSTGYAKAEIIALILQTGTESNLKKLLAGYGWTVTDWNRFIARMQQEGILTEADMDRVQRIWDMFEANKEKSQRAYKYVYGRYFEEIPARPFMMFGKMYKGGYAPLVYDSRETDAGKKQESDFKEDMQALFPAPDAGFAKSRTEYIGELSLDIMRIQRGFKDQILFSEMGPVYADLQKIFRQPELSKALKEYDDRLYARVIEPWMKRAVHQSIDTGRERSAADRIFRSLRNISSVTTMAGNVVNAVEGLTDIPAAVKVVGFRSFSDATKQFMASPRESQRMIRELSPYMNKRMSAAYTSLDARLEESVNPNKIQRWNRFISDHAFFVQTVFDRFIICPTWIASYNNALASGLTEKDAILKADSDVRRVQSDYSPESLSNLEAGSPFVRLFTQFTSYFITRGNLVASESSVAIRQGASKLAVMFGWMLMAGIPAWLSKALQIAASGSDDDREFSDWIVEIFGLGSLDYVLSMTGAGRYAATMINDIQRADVSTILHRVRSECLNRCIHWPKTGLKAIR